MPFDGTGLPTPTVPNTGLFPPWSRHCWRLWFESLGFTPEHTEITRIFLPAVPGRDRDTAVVRLLQDARGLIEDPRNWTKGSYRSLGGRRCAVGALRAAAKRLDDPRIAFSAHALLIKVAGAHGFSSVEMMNDKSGHASVLHLFDKAIAAARITEAATQSPFGARRYG
jgi:hypothetical protein